MIQISTHIMYHQAFSLAKDQEQEQVVVSFSRWSDISEQIKT